MNIPIEVARAQASHGIKGAAHGIKGGRPRLDLDESERIARRNDQRKASRERKKRQDKGGTPKQAHTQPDAGPGLSSYLRFLEKATQVETQGRNEPCQCGSGRKFKKCCGA